MFEIIFKSLIIGGLAGGAISAGAARMFHAPKLQGLGAFRTLGEMNACHGDSISHASFGAGFFITSAAAAVGSGALTQDVLHRVIPNWAAALVGINKKGDEKPHENPSLMLVAGVIVGAAVMVFLNVASSLVPLNIATMAKDILAPAADQMIKIVMPLLFLWAALDDGQVTGSWSLALGSAMYMISGNALPGIIFGILIGNSAKESGYGSKATRTMILIVFALIILIAYFRGFHNQIFALMGGK